MAASVPAVASGKTFDLCYCNYDSPGFDPDRHFAFLRGDVLRDLVVCLFFRGWRVASTGSATRKFWMSIRIPKEAIDYLDIKNLDRKPGSRSKCHPTTVRW